MKVVLGIGNPGRKYEGTRHNVGHRVVDRAAAALGAEMKRRRHGGLVGEAAPGGRAGGERVVLVKPATYVNLSGECARAVLDYHGAGPESLLVVADDVNLPLGEIRARRSGSSGGHKGLLSVAAHLGTEEFARLRVGVGRPPAATAERGTRNAERGTVPPSPRGESGVEGEVGDLVGHVLGVFSREERELMDAAEARAAEAAVEWALRGIDACMNRFNGPAPGSGRPGADGGEAG